MSTTKTYSDFREVTELLNRLNAALITAKRLALRTSPPPDSAAITDATEALQNFLEQHRPKKTPASRTSTTPFRLKSRGLVLNPDEIDRCLARLRKGLSHLGHEDLQFLEKVVRDLDQSSESLYRQMARL